MANEKLNEVWKIMKNNELEFDNNINNNMLCIICKKVLINAHSGPCGCRYCLDCITGYLNGEEKICPGDTNDCRDEFINIKKNLSIDHPKNQQILKMIVKCPVNNCQFKDVLKNIENHIRVCDFQDNCPYFHMGCKIASADMKKHMLNEIVSHTKMWFEMFDNLKNEIQMLKEDKIELKRDNEDLKKFIDDLQLKYENENREIKEKLRDMENKLYEGQQGINDLQLKYANENKERNEKIKEVDKKIDMEQKEAATKIDKLNEIITDLKLKSNKNNEATTNIENKMKVLEKNQDKLNFGEFVWVVDNWKEKVEQAKAGINTDIYSDVFYSHRNGYKMCLSMNPNGFSEGKGTHLSVYFHLMRGEFNDILSWPFTYDVTFELIDQRTTQIHITQTAKYDTDPNMSSAYQKLTTERNRGYGFPKFISLNDLSNNPSLIDNDKIFIKFRVDIDYNNY